MVRFLLWSWAQGVGVAIAASKKARHKKKVRLPNLTAGRTCTKTERRLLCACYAPTSSSRAADELVTRRLSLSGTFAPAHTVQHKPMAVGATLALMS